MSRLATGVWVSAYRARLEAKGIGVVVAAKGDPVAGAVLVKLSTMDGQARLFHRVWDPLADTRRWDLLAEGSEEEVDAAIARQRRFDPDLWVLDVEDARGRHLLDEEGLE